MVPTTDKEDAALVVVRREECPECAKRNALTHYADGSAVCFTKGCGYRIGDRPDTRPKMDPIPRGLLKPDEGSFREVRRINTDTLKRYGSFLAGYKGARELVTPVYDNTGVMVAQQVRRKDGQAEVIGERGTGRQLGGQHVYGDRYDRRVVIHSDALDAMSTAQVSRFKCASVHVLGTSAEASRELKENYRWLDRFQEIVLFFQDTPEWQQQAQQCASIFPAGKVKLARIGEFTGPNEALQGNRPGDIEQAIWSANPWRPIGIVNATDLRDKLFKEGLQTPSWPYPWPEYNRATMGMRPGECTYHIGGTGIAKTTLMLHYMNKLVGWEGGEFIDGFPHQGPCKVGWMGFEDLTKQVLVAGLGIHSGRMLSLQPVTEAEGLKLFDEMFSNGRLELYDPEQAEYGLEAVFSYMRYMVKALDCKVIFLDPLTFLVSQLPAANRTQEEDKMAGRLAAEAKALGVHIHIGYHLKKPDGTPFEEGAQIGLPDIKGSGALSHFAHNVLAYERNQQGDRPDLLRVRSLKNRVARFTGEVCILRYDMDTGRYEPTDESWPDDGDEGSHKNNNKKSNKSQGFTPVSGGDY